jgi:hypothetical protein
VYNDFLIILAYENSYNFMSVFRHHTQIKNSITPIFDNIEKSCMNELY